MPDRMRVGVLAVVIGMLGAGLAGASPKSDLRAEAVVLNWDRLSCFAYSRVDRGYACVDFSAGADDGDPGLTDFEAWNPPRDTAWHGHKAVVLVADKTKVFLIAEKAYDSSARVAQWRAPIEAVQAAIARGYRRPVSRTTPLPNGAWRPFQGVWLRFETRMHEGDASYQNHGTLRMSCRKPDQRTDGRVLIADNQAESAVAFAAPGARVIAVGFVEVDGGEGAEYYNTDYLRIDLSRLCKIGPASKR